MKNNDWVKQYKTKEWYKRREYILRRDDYTCKQCGSEQDMNVHHRQYLRREDNHDLYKDVWENPDHLLETLCAPCNKREKVQNEVKYEVTTWLNANFLTDGLAHISDGLKNLVKFKYTVAQTVQLARGIYVMLSAEHYHKILFALGNRQTRLGQQSLQLPLNDQVIVLDDERCFT